MCVHPLLFVLQAAAHKAEADQTRRRTEAEKIALEIRASMLAPQFRSLEEGRATLQGLQREGFRETERLSLKLGLTEDLQHSASPRKALIFTAELNPFRVRSHKNL